VSLVEDVVGAGGWCLLGGKGVWVNGEDGTLNDNLFRNGQQQCTIAPDWGLLGGRPGVSGFQQPWTAVVLIESLQAAFWCFLVPAQVLK
jgi:hypothetical protein